MRVGIAMYSFQGSPAGALHGIGSYATPERNWMITRDNQILDGVTRILASAPDGVLVNTPDQDVLALLEKARIPVVNLQSRGFDGMGRVINDDLAIGRMAADYFLTRGYKHFAYYALLQSSLDRRFSGFSERLARAGHSVDVYAPEHPPQALVPHEPALTIEAEVNGWLMGLPKGTAILCAHDYFAAFLAEACTRLKIRVPLELAILGVDNTTAICLLGMPQLSSIQVASERMGYEAAALLDQLMLGKEPPSRSIRVPPVRVVSRRSTDTMVSAEPFVEKALRYMSEHLKAENGFDGLCRAVHCSRSNLARRFSPATGLTPAEAWNRFRIEEAQRLLVETDVNLSRIAELSGFSDANHLSLVFKRLVGQTPSEFRHHVLL